MPCPQATLKWHCLISFQIRASTALTHATATPQGSGAPWGSLQCREGCWVRTCTLLRWEMHHARCAQLGRSDPQCYSSSVCSILFYFSLLWGSLGSPLTPWHKVTTFILWKFNIFAKPTSRSCIPRPLPPPCCRGDAWHSHNPWVLGAALCNSEEFIPQSQKEICSDAQAFFFFKFILRFLQHSLLLPCTAAIDK